MKNLFTLLLITLNLGAIDLSINTNSPAPGIFWYPTNFVHLQPGVIEFHYYQDATAPTNVFPEISKHINDNSYGINSMTFIRHDIHDGWFFYEPWNKVHLYNSAWINNPSTLSHELGHVVNFASEGDMGTLDLIITEGYGDQDTPMGRSITSSFYQHHHAFNKEMAGWIGLNGLRSIHTIESGNNTFSITRIDQQSEGAKAVKILYWKQEITKTDGSVFYDKRRYLYLEQRPTKYLSSYKPSKRHSVTTYGTDEGGIQVHAGEPRFQQGGYVPNWRSPNSVRVSNIGYRGGLRSGQSFSIPQTLSTQRTYSGATNITTRNINVNILSATTSNAMIRVSIQ